MSKDQPTEEDPSIEAVEPAEEEESELERKVWAVIGFGGCIANGLTYDQAVKAVSEASGEKIPGLCIVTDEAAARFKSGRNSVL